MARGKPVPVGPTARLQGGLTWQQMGDLRPEDIQQRGIFPYPSLPHPLQTNGGQVFPKMQIEMFPRLERFDVDHDLPEAFLPEFPPAILLAIALNWATFRAARSSQSTTFTGCSRIF